MEISKCIPKTKKELVNGLMGIALVGVALVGIARDVPRLQQLEAMRHRAVIECVKDGGEIVFLPRPIIHSADLSVSEIYEESCAYRQNIY